MSKPAMRHPILLLLTAVSALPAQTPGLPLWSAPTHTPGPSLHAAVGIGDGDLGGQRAAGATLGYAWSALRVTATLARVGSRDDRHSGTTAAGATVSYQLRRLYSPSVALALQSGVGGASFELAAGSHSQLNLPLGLGAAFLGPLPIGNVELWVTPRLQLRRSRLTQNQATEARTDLGAGVAAGIEWTSVHGPGVHLGGEWFRIRSITAGRAGNEWNLSVGVHYRTIL